MFAPKKLGPSTGSGSGIFVLPSHQKITGLGDASQCMLFASTTADALYSNLQPIRFEKLKNLIILGREQTQIHVIHLSFWDLHVSILLAWHPSLDACEQIARGASNKQTQIKEQILSK